ncbi:MAG: tyrosine-type recombinase/integrase [Ketobacter sp.]|nr:tyrosine-type recombinase/integrase [Ketobacter sp.]
MKSVRWSINRLKRFLISKDLYQKQIEQAPLYQPLLLEYCQWLEQSRNLCLGTIELRERSLVVFFSHIGPVATQQRCAELSASDIQDFLIEYSQHHSFQLRRSMQAALRTFFVFCLQKDYIHQPLEGAVPKLRTYKLATVARGFTDEQALKVIDCIDRDAASGKRDYAMCQLLYHYGVRGGQVRGLLLEDVDWNQSQILFRSLKHGKQVMLPLTQIVGDSLIDYLQHERPDSPNPYLFLKSHAPYHELKSAGVLTGVVSRYVQRSGIETNCTGSHALRHGFATRLLAQGNSLKAIADMLGHRHLGSTLHYAKVNFNQLHQVALAWPGRDPS